MKTQQSEALRLADEWQRKTQREADRQNSAYDRYGMGNTPETVDPLGSKMVAELRTQRARITELESQLAQRFDAADTATASAQGDALDAVRYRFLRDGEWRDTDLEPFIRLQLNTLWDAKIDAARAARGAAQAQAAKQQEQLI